MQVTETQVQRSLRALEADEGDGGAAVATVAAPDAPVESLPAGLVERLTGSSAIRTDRLEEARRRLESGEQPSAEALAQRMVGRLVCDRLR